MEAYVVSVWTQENGFLRHLFVKVSILLSTFTNSQNRALILMNSQEWIAVYPDYLMEKRHLIQHCLRQMQHFLVILVLNWLERGIYGVYPVVCGPTHLGVMVGLQ